MPRGPLPQYRMRKSNFDAHLKASMDQAGGKFDAETGEYATLRDTGHKTREAAVEVQRGIFNARRYVGVKAKVKIVAEADGSYSVEFAAVNPDHARAYMIAKYGTDRTKWPYDPRKKGK